MRNRGWLTLLLISPFAIVVLGMQVVIAVSAVSAVQVALGVGRHSADSLERGTDGLAAAAHINDQLWSSLPARLLSWNPLTLGAVDDVAAAARAGDAASDLLAPAGELAVIARGLDGRPPLIVAGRREHRPDP